ncbi:MAG TPA: tRNA preQ1(34) S-adenosylmethionine ribosyltransferase-isomerase QueA [Verrucomicrobiae bacterium]|nr:tRNA preQ1(34) S-adenosylmethionine ribosyltransferase-isomerase QueA [Verrucomicrobiae bacterium]
MRVSDYTYVLPEERIALFPPEERGASHLLVLDSQSGKIEHKGYQDLLEYLEPGDVVVLNNTKVIRARLMATTSSGQTRELLLLEDHHNTVRTKRKVLYRGKLRETETLTVGPTTVHVDSILGDGIAEISSQQDLLELATHTGSVPLPPYMHRDATPEDTERYQTVFAESPGSVAAPTASFNFTRELEARIRAKNVSIAYLTLHVGLGTFLPIRSDNIQEHTMHSEYFEIPKNTAEIIKNTLYNRGKIVAIGTTVARTLEYAAPSLLGSPATDVSGEADIFIYPGYTFKVVTTLLTNFHAPKSTVLMLAAAKAGWQNLERAYHEALDEDYMFLSYGDSMLIL